MTARRDGVVTHSRDVELAFTLTSFFVFAANASPFAVTNVYTPCTPERRPEFLDELRAIARSCALPWILVGNLNLARCPDEKNTPNFDAGAAGEFNLAIEDLSLQDLPLTDRRFTWSNCRADPTLVRLDRVLINLEWNSLLFNTTLRSAARTTSDHVPLIVDAVSRTPAGSLFRYERCWAFSEEYRTLIRDIWARPQNRRGRTAQLLARTLKWATCASKKWARDRKRPGEVVSNCLAVVELQDLTEEVHTLLSPELLLRSFVKERLSEEYKKLDVYWRQRYAYRLCKLGDGNTSFFHAGASARLRKNQIQVLHANHSHKARLLSDFYSSLLGTAAPSSWSFDPRIYLDRVPHLDELEKPFTMEELKKRSGLCVRTVAPVRMGLGLLSSKPSGTRSRVIYRKLFEGYLFHIENFFIRGRMQKLRPFYRDTAGFFFQKNSKFIFVNFRNN